MNIRDKYKKETGNDWKMSCSKAQPTVDYVWWIEKQLRIGDVSQQRELLKDFLQYVNCSDTDSKVSFDLLDKYLNSL